MKLICEKRNSVSEKPQITVESNIPVTIEVIWNDGKEKETITIN